MKNKRNYYRILHVQPDAPREIIKASYRTLMQKLRHHPDLGGDSWNASILNEAYAILTDPEKRSAYDQQFLYKCRTSRQQTGKQGRSREKQQKRKSAKPTHDRKGRPVCLFCGAPKPVVARYSSASDCGHCHSPLKTVVRLQLAGKTRRALRRTSHHGAIVYFTHPEETTGKSGSTRDLSPQGIQFLTNCRLEDGQVIRIVSHALSAVARVTHCHQHNRGMQYVIGAEFLTLHFYMQSGTFISEKV